ncbi:Tetratricopeptide TPR_2 repeat-containing protein [Emticicia oligotrophica DSM 17448]|uniref:Tetratricopeptide TPR_2 repeat-containing protein n=1 Tax=Emticicia oligotrophica (strain DSM 17448 / CIP 109782 / MTCC 6937 / GPTSA100-15) TaxID=929562 RepID=A0ABM5N5N1_EMTOG|nr:MULTISPECIES: tetratricopeptide repeat protein [Emticicia]AFK04737.1 Tetratricopeptide TPR_2 repeat-containing protein [Emticicia oligotrophica DSM 17448]
MNKILKSLAVAAVAVLASFQTMAQTVQDGLKNLDAERYNAAETIFKQLVSSAPTAENYYYLGYYYLNLQDGANDLEKAKDAFTKGAALDAKRPDPLNRVGLATVKLLSGDRAGAKADFDLIKKDTKNKNADVMFRIGEAYALSDKVNDPAEAVTNIQAGLDLQKVKNNPDYYIAMAKAYLIKNDGGAAMTALENAANMGQKLAKIKTLMGRVWYQGKQYQKAQGFFNEAIAADPEYAPAYYYLSNLFTTFGNFGQAAKNAKLALEKSEATPAEKLRYIKLATASKDYEGALSILNQIFDTEKDPIKFRLKGYIQVEKGECADGVKNIGEFLNQAAKERHLASDWGMLGRGYACIKDDANKKLNDSLAVFNMETAIEKGDSTYDYRGAIVNIYKAQRNWSRVAESYEKQIAVSKKGGTATDYYNLADAYMRGRNFSKADTIYSKAIELYKDTWLFPYMQKARAKQYALGTTVDSTFSAAPYYEKYVNLSTDVNKADPKNAKYFSEAYGYLGYKALLVEKNPAKATEFMNLALKFDPTNTKAQQVLQSINAGTTPAAGTTPSPNNNSPSGGAQPKN